MKRIKRFIYTFIALFILFPCITNAATELSAATQNPVVGNYVYVQLEANYGEEFKIRDFHVFINYDTSYFSLEEVIWLKFGAEKGTYKTDKGQISIDKDGANWSSGPVAQLKLKVLKSGFSEITVKPNGVSYYTDGNPIAQTTVGISINATEPSTETLLGSLYVEGYSIQPTFSKTTYNYNLIVPADVTSVKVVADRGDKRQTITGAGTRKLEYGPNRVRIIVEAQDKSTRTYEIMINRKDNRTGDTSLKSLNVSNTNIEYEQGKVLYTATVSRSIDNVMITGRTTDPNATLIGTGTKNLKIGKNEFELEVQSSGGKKEKYTIQITRSEEELQVIEKSEKLLSLKVNNLVLDLSDNKTEFLYGIGKEYSALTIEATAESKTAKVTVEGNKDLKPGINVVTIKVAENAGTEDEISQEYKLIVYKSPNKVSTVTDLKEIKENTDYLFNTTSQTNNIVPKEVLKLLKSNNNKLYYNVVNMSNGLMNQVILKNNLPDEDLDVTITKTNNSPLTYQINIPKDNEVKIFIDKAYPDNSTVKVFSYNENGNYTLVTAGVTVKNGYITFDTNGEQYYVITTSDLVKEKTAMEKLVSKYQTIIISVIVVIVIVCIVGNILSRRNQEKESNEPLY